MMNLHPTDYIEVVARHVIKGTVCAISSDSPCKARLAKISLKALSNQLEIHIYV